MPITSELQNVRELKEVGFSEKQAEKLAELFERSQSQGFEKFAELLDRRLGEMEARFNARLDAFEARVDSKFESQRAEFYKALHDNNLKLMAAVIAVVSLATAIIKLFPNWPGPIGP
jgi:flagellar biosynthesis/type III secretory pathway protein FliH